MKRATALSVLAAFVVSISGAEAETPNGPKMFATKDECEAALKSGDFRYYKFRYDGLKHRNPVDGVNLIRVELEADRCILTQVVGQRSFVVQKEGTPFRARPQRDGSFVLAYMHGCGNKVYEAVLPAPPLPVAEMEPEPERRLILRDNFPLPPAEKVQIAAVYPEPEKKKGGKKWWIIGGTAGAVVVGVVTWILLTCPPGTGIKRR